MKQLTRDETKAVAGGTGGEAPDLGDVLLPPHPVPAGLSGDPPLRAAPGIFTVCPFAPSTAWM